MAHVQTKCKGFVWVPWPLQPTRGHLMLPTVTHGQDMIQAPGDRIEGPIANTGDGPPDFGHFMVQTRPHYASSDTFYRVLMMYFLAYLCLLRWKFPQYRELFDVERAVSAMAEWPLRAVDMTDLFT